MHCDTHYERERYRERDTEREIQRERYRERYRERERETGQDSIELKMADRRTRTTFNDQHTDHFLIRLLFSELFPRNSNKSFTHDQSCQQ